MSNRTRHMSHRLEVEKVTRARGRTLEWSGRPGGVVVVATTGMLMARLDGRRRSWGQDEVLHGGWREESSVLFWEAGGECLGCALNSPRGLLSILRERVFVSTATIVNHDLSRGTVQIVARHNLLDGDATWLTSVSDGASLGGLGMAAFMVAEIDWLRSEYGL